MAGRRDFRPARCRGGRPKQSIYRFLRADIALFLDARKTGVLRREGLYQSQVREWRAERDAKAAGLVPPRNSHRASPRSSLSETERLRAENARLTKELAKSQAVVEIMGKLIQPFFFPPPAFRLNRVFGVRVPTVQCLFPSYWVSRRLVMRIIDQRTIASWW